VSAPHSGSTPRPSKAGVLLFAHGSRDPLWHVPIQAVQAELQRLQPDLPCACAYLEISRPDLPCAVEQLVQQGCTRITVLPLFLGTGRHAREDLPLLLDAVRAAHPDLVLESATPVGEDPRVIALLAQIAQGEIYKKPKS
jgi:sirohydrochlorin cobaltochelatase